MDEPEGCYQSDEARGGPSWDGKRIDLKVEACGALLLRFRRLFPGEQIVVLLAIFL